MTDTPIHTKDSPQAKELLGNQGAVDKSDIRYWGKVLGLEKTDTNVEDYKRSLAEKRQEAVAQLPQTKREGIERILERLKKWSLFLEKEEPGNNARIILEAAFIAEQRNYSPEEYQNLPTLNEEKIAERLMLIRGRGANPNIEQSLDHLARSIELGATLDSNFLIGNYTDYDELEKFAYTAQAAHTLLEQAREAGYLKSFHDLVGENHFTFDFLGRGEVFKEGAERKRRYYSKRSMLGEAIYTIECLSNDPKKRAEILQDLIKTNGLFSFLYDFRTLRGEGKIGLNATNAQKEAWRVYTRIGRKVSIDPEMFSKKSLSELLHTTSEPKGRSLWVKASDFVDELNDDDFNSLSEKEQEFWRAFKRCPASIRDQIVWDNEPDVQNDAAEIERLVTTSTVLQLLETSSSKEVQKLKHRLFNLILKSNNPKVVGEKILSIFERNHLPFVGKIYNVFEQIYSRKEIEEMLSGAEHLSPALKKTTPLGREIIIYRDLLKTHLYSGEPSLSLYLQALQEGQLVCDKAYTEGEKTLNDSEKAQLKHFLDKMDTLYESSLYGKRSAAESTREVQDIRLRIQQLRKNFGIEDSDSIPLTERVAGMFLRPLGFTHIEQALAEMGKQRTAADTRNKAYYNEIKDNPSVISSNVDGYVKVVPSEYLDMILQGGAVAREYLGAEADSDRTPFDTDVLKVDAGIRYKLDRGSSYGDLMLIFRDRGQFHLTNLRSDDNPDISKYEVFFSGVVSQNHYGIRTGIASTEIDCIVIANPDNAEQIYNTIALNGFYIPVVDNEGHVVFSPEDYERYSIQVNAIKNVLERSDSNPQELINSLKASQYLKKLFEMSAGVWEGYSLEQHTRMVLEKYKEYIAGKFTSSIISEQGFMLMLALHDIGKPLAYEREKSTENQHEYTMRFLPSIVQGFGFSAQEAEVIASVAGQDYLGQYMQDNISTEEAGNAIYRQAVRLGVPPKELFDLIILYYKCDAGSYPGLLSGLFQVNRTTQELAFRDEVANKVNKLEPYIYIQR